MRKLGGTALDEAAFAEFCRDHSREVLVFFLRHGLGPHEAQELAQESWIRFWERRHRAHTDCRRAFIYGIARNVLLEHRRNRRQLLERMLMIFPPCRADVKDTPLDTMLRNETDARVRGALNRLPGFLQNVLHLIHFEGLSQAEVARRLGTCRQRIHEYHRDALRRLRSILEETQD